MLSKTAPASTAGSVINENALLGERRALDNVKSIDKPSLPESDAPRPVLVAASPTTQAKPKVIASSWILSGDEWLDRELTVDASQIVFGTPEKPVITLGTKNIIQAPDKSFKTTFSLPLCLGVSKGMSVFSELPVPGERRVLYLHGELGDYQIKDRTECAQKGHQLPRPLNNFFQGRDIQMHLVKKEGQVKVRDAVVRFRPDLLVLDPLQQFITGCEENSFKEMSEATRFLDALIEEFGVTVVLIAHTGKNKDAGVRGHSVFAGWRDTLMVLNRVQANKLRVEVKPRWGAADFEFHLQFKNGTMVPTVHFSGKNAEIRDFVAKKGGRCSHDELLQFLCRDLITDPKRKESSRKAIARSVEAGAIGKDEDHSVFIPDFGPEETDSDTP